MADSGKKRGLKKGFTTGTCAAAAAKAAVLALFSRKIPETVDITLPIGRIVTIPVQCCRKRRDGALMTSVIKDAGDDPDVTNGAEITAEICKPGLKIMNRQGLRAFKFEVSGSLITILAGEGIGVVTKPGLAIPPGEPAINPVPRRMIEEAVRDVASRFSAPDRKLSITISVLGGKDIAKKTMNSRLGIIGGISILGTTGIVEPMSLSAYRESIILSFNIAKAAGQKEVVLSTGRGSENVARQVLSLSDEAFILVGDHMGFALEEIKKEEGRVFARVIIAGQFGKFSKLAAGHFQTHCKKSRIELDFLAALAETKGVEKAVIDNIKRANTAREVFSILANHRLKDIFLELCRRVKDNASRIAGPGIDIGYILAGYSSKRDNGMLIAADI